MTLQPKEPEKEAGQKARQAYLALAQQVIGDSSLDYTTLYQRFAQNDWAAIKLDDAVAAAALRQGLSPKETATVLHQGPYMQYQVHQQQAPIPAMRQYIKATVMQAVQRRVKTWTAQTKFQEQSTQRKTGFEME
ncbi:MAG: hypothetical protein F6J97_22535 [Leptolyngbya sp. SIO4C1]|nr:hypothetical protein [Leptolyngbya sp. SIO4C1]